MMKRDSSGNRGKMKETQRAVYFRVNYMLKHSKPPIVFSNPDKTMFE